MDTADHAAIDAIASAFFGLFDNRDGRAPSLRAVVDLCIPSVIISKCSADIPDVMDLEAFIAPRAAILGNGTLTDFHEVETAHRTDIVGNVGQRISTYTKSGVMRGERFEARGIKVFQLAFRSGRARCRRAGDRPRRALFTGRSRIGSSAHGCGCRR